MRFPRSKKTLQRWPKTRQARRCITRGTGAGWSSRMTRGWSCLLSAVRPGFIPRDTPERRRRIRKELKNSWARCDSWARCEVKKDPSVPRVSFVRLRSRWADERWRSSRIALTEKSWRRRADRADLAMIQCSTSRPSRKHLRKSLLKKKISAATGERLSADCSQLLPPCYSFGSYVHETEEKTVRKEETGFAKSETSEICKGSQALQAGACGGNGPQACCRNPHEAGRSVRERDVRAEARECIPTADLHDPFRAMHGRARKSGRRNAL